ncbi:MAG: FG-GAP-like repeat-containing protein [Acidobacteriota bacterium]|nr:FG-GAP-like repeat-containing protein [Acidobacteriota bacterium]
MIRTIRFFNGKLFSILFGSLAIALLAVFSVSAQAVTFSGKQLQTGGQYQVAADFNGDGRQDLAVAGTEIEILLGQGDGTFQAGAKYPVVVGSAGFPQSIIKGDFNGDGRVDLAMSINAPNQVAVLLGNGDGTFQPIARFSTNSGGTPTSVVTADFNRDGKADLMTSDQIACGDAGCVVTRTVTLFLGNGDGSFAAPQQIDVGNAPTKVAVGDFNHDGIADAAIAGNTGGKVFTLIGNGDGTFRQLPDIIVVSTTDNTDVAVGDFNGDTIQDLVVAAEGESKVGILLGNGDGTFGAASIIVDVEQQRAASLTLGDINRDGILDIVLGHSFCCEGGVDLGAFGVLYGNGNGTFQTVSRYIVPANGRVGLSGGNPLVADFNGDGKPDVAANYTSNMGGSTGGTLVAMNTTGVAPARLALGTMSVAPASIVGGTFAQVNIALAPGAVAPTGLTTFTVTSSNPSVVSVPTNSTTSPLGIVGGMTNLRFNVNTNTVTAPQTVTITAGNKNLGSRSVNLTVTPPNTPLAIGSIQMQPAGVFGGGDATGVVALATGHVAPVGGALVTLTNDNSNLVLMPMSVTIPTGQTYANFAIQTNTTGITTPVSISASYGGATKSAILTVSAPTQAVPISSVTLSPDTVVGGSNVGVSVTITLASGAPNEGATIMLSSSNPSVTSVPLSTRIFFSGQTTVSTGITVAPVSAPTQVAITATYGSSSQSAILTVTAPSTTAPSLTSLTINPASVAGGSASQGTVTLSAAATSPTTVTLTSSSSPIVTVPASVTVPAGATSANFTVNTTSVSSSFNATVGASLNGISQSVTLTVTPAADTVGISRTEYTASNRSLRVEATGTRTNATLQVFVTSSSQLVGTLTNNGGGKYSGQFNLSVNPQNITVRSNFGGSASSGVVLK